MCINGTVWNSYFWINLTKALTFYALFTPWLLQKDINDLKFSEKLSSLSFAVYLTIMTNIHFLCCTPPVESIFETFLNCHVKFSPWRWHQIKELIVIYSSIIRRDNHFVDWKSKLVLVSIFGNVSKPASHFEDTTQLWFFREKH